MPDVVTYGWDTSHYDDPPTSRDGIDFFSHKLTDGDHYYEDPEYTASMNAMRGLGVEVLGAYHVLHGKQSISNQVDWFIQRATALTPWWHDEPDWFWQLDCEPFTYLVRPTIDECNQAADLLVQRTGRRAQAVWGYLAPWSYGVDVQRFKYPFWNSNYGTNPTGPYRNVYPGNSSSRWIGGGRRADILQYGSNTIIAGQTTCDANAYAGTLDQLKTFIRGSGGTDMSAIMLIARKSDGQWFWADPVARTLVKVGSKSSHPEAGQPDAMNAQVLNDFWRYDGHDKPMYAATVYCTPAPNRNAEPYGTPLASPTYDDLIAMGFVDTSVASSGGSGVTVAQVAGIADARINAAKVDVTTTASATITAAGE